MTASLPAAAHHSSAPHFDRDTEITVEGVVTEWRFVNPHAYVYFDVTDEAGEVVSWRCESSAATALGRRGWSSETFYPGQKIRILGAPAWREDNVCFLNTVTFGDGRTVGRNDEMPAIMSIEDEPAASIERSAYLENGAPNLQGAWVRAPRSTPRGTGGTGGGPGISGIGGPGRSSAHLMTDAGNAAADVYDMRFDDPSLKCSPANIIFGWTHDRHVNDIQQTDSIVTLTYGYMDFVRTIHLDQSQHPEDIVPGIGGHSIGRWEGDTLVVDTVGFDYGLLQPHSPLMHSDRMRIVERFTLDNEAGTLTRSYVINDSLYLREPIVTEDVMNLSATPYEPYNCVELSGKNNQRTVSDSR